ncbi:hypothetical protein [uncultured Methanoregula sp.]|uniref:hypothetical protein n=1 Tax=uncultured Methanoregula sp. TaxID=1005933 RepID=UPI002AAAE682|nr:hypothetical protein [uncultured Methanoregula sp.]
MSCRVGFVWDTKQHFNRYIEDCGLSCDLITPYMLAAPFFRGTYNCIIIPTGFANPAYSNLLPALRASSPRIIRFIESGGNLLVFGAATEKTDSYDWLPFPVTYLHEFGARGITCTPGSLAGSIIEDYDAARIECDGTFPEHGADCTGRSGSGDVIIEKQIGSGRVFLTTIHEFPSRAFLSGFCRSGIPTLF